MQFGYKIDLDVCWIIDTIQDAKKLIRCIDLYLDCLLSLVVVVNLKRERPRKYTIARAFELKVKAFYFSPGP